MFLEYLRNTVWIALGGALGAAARYAVYSIFLSVNINGFWATVSVNVIGSFTLGYLSEWLPEVYPKLQLLFMIGCLGAFTTFSTFSADFVKLMDDKQWLIASMYLVFSVLGGFAAYIWGTQLASKWM